jgi:hypothetical protein
MEGALKALIIMALALFVAYLIVLPLVGLREIAKSCVNSWFIGWLLGAICKGEVQAANVLIYGLGLIILAIGAWVASKSVVEDG